MVRVGQWRSGLRHGEGSSHTKRSKYTVAVEKRTSQLSRHIRRTCSHATRRHSNLPYSFCSSAASGRFLPPMHLPCVLPPRRQHQVRPIRMVLAMHSHLGSYEGYAAFGLPEKKCWRWVLRLLMMVMDVRNSLRAGRNWREGGKPGHKLGPDYAAVVAVAAALLHAYGLQHSLLRLLLQDRLPTQAQKEAWALKSSQCLPLDRESRRRVELRLAIVECPEERISGR